MQNTQLNNKMQRSRISKILQITYILALIVLIIEFLFIQGLFTWFYSLFGFLLIGIVNLVYAMLKKQWSTVFSYFFLTLSICSLYMLYSIHNP